MCTVLPGDNTPVFGQPYRCVRNYMALGERGSGSSAFNGEFRMDKAATTPDNTIRAVMAAIDKARVDLRRVAEAAAANPTA